MSLFSTRVSLLATFQALICLPSLMAAACGVPEPPPMELSLLTPHVVASNLWSTQGLLLSGNVLPPWSTQVDDTEEEDDDGEEDEEDDEEDDDTLSNSHVPQTPQAEDLPLEDVNPICAAWMNQLRQDEQALLLSSEYAELSETLAFKHLQQDLQMLNFYQCHLGVYAPAPATCASRLKRYLYDLAVLQQTPEYAAYIATDAYQTWHDHQSAALQDQCDVSDANDTDS